MDDPPLEIPVPMPPVVAWPVLASVAAVKLALGLVVGSGYGFSGTNFITSRAGGGRIGATSINRRWSR